MSGPPDLRLDPDSSNSLVLLTRALFVLGASHSELAELIGRLGHPFAATDETQMVLAEGA
ncbi:hypothetical protein [uncultured Thiodictyon sp.]|uniref:hypothetical protein n=1 Tax=uncultured Thiodictyon sp. TaxID=1846217 RepID=UPI0025E5F7AE|nr:hypothetical protein [uncultured Thiodictyon sp.]